MAGKHKKELLTKEKAIFSVIKDEVGKIDNMGKNIDQNVVTFLCISMSHWLGYWYKKGEGMEIDTIIDHNIRIIFHGIL